LGQDPGVATLNNMMVDEMPVLIMGNETGKWKLIDQRGSNKSRECKIRLVDGADGSIHLIDDAAAAMQPRRGQ